MDGAEKRGQLIRHLEDALALAVEIDDGHTGYLIDRAMDEARSRQFRLIGLTLVCVLRRRTPLVHFVLNFRDLAHLHLVVR
jgi:hypothetical protein